MRDLSAHAPTAAGNFACLRNVLAAEGAHTDPLLCCAGCGTMPSPGEAPRELVCVGELQRLLLTPAQLALHLAVPEEFRPALPVSRLAGDVYYALEPSLLLRKPEAREGGSEGSDASLRSGAPAPAAHPSSYYAPLCAHCRGASEGSPYKFSFAAGVAFGNTAALGLPTLTLAESILLSPLRLYNVVLIVSATGAASLSGHAICFPQPAALAGALPALLRPEAALASLSIFFVGPEGKRDVLASRLLGTGLLSGGGPRGPKGGANGRAPILFDDSIVYNPL